MTRTFQIGKTYSCRSACNYDCVFEFKVLARTAKQITIEDCFGKIRKRGIKVSSDGAEWCLPLGSYSMAPVINA